MWTSDEIMDQAMLEGGNRLDLSRAGLVSIPERVFEFKELVHLNLSDHSDHHFNELMRTGIISSFSVGGSFGAHNEIREIPDAISQFKKLKVLLLSGNRIELLPECIDALASLEYLDLSNNPIQRLPVSILNLKCLKKIVLRRTPLYGKLENHLLPLRKSPYHEPDITRALLELATRL